MSHSVSISNIHAREIIDSRGNPTVEVELQTKSGHVGRAAVPSGASTGAFEAHELRDGDSKRFAGKGVLTAVNNVNTVIKKSLVGQTLTQSQLDKVMLELDGTKNKSKLGANALLGVSLAAARASALDQGKMVFETFGTKSYKLPVPLMNVINGGAHANNNLDVQEFMLVPQMPTFHKALQAGCEVFHKLKSLLAKAGHSVAVGDEGGFAPNLKANEEALKLLLEAISLAGYTPGKDIALALDVASTEFFNTQKQTYSWEGSEISAKALADVYAAWVEKYPLISIEDPFSEEDWSGWKLGTQLLKSRTQLVGDDLFVTNSERLQRGLNEGVATALLVKPNQIGTLSETIQAIELAHSAHYTCIMSHRSGETEDSLIADLCVGLNCAQIKTGSLSRGERTAKYNQLLRIEEKLLSK